MDYDGARAILAAVLTLAVKDAQAGPAMGGAHQGRIAASGTPSLSCARAGARPSSPGWTCPKCKPTSSPLPGTGTRKSAQNLTI
jgi:hypothetical protein